MSAGNQARQLEPENADPHTDECVEELHEPEQAESYEQDLHMPEQDEYPEAELQGSEPHNAVEEVQEPEVQPGHG